MCRKDLSYLYLVYKLGTAGYLWGFPFYYVRRLKQTGVGGLGDAREELNVFTYWQLHSVSAELINFSNCSLSRAKYFWDSELFSLPEYSGRAVLSCVQYKRLRTSEITSTTSSFLLPTAILVSISLCSSRQHGSDCNVRISSVLSIQIVTSQPPAGVDLVTACIYLAQLTAWIIYFQTWSTKVVLVKSGRNWRGDSEIRIVISASWSLNSGGQGCDPLESESDTFLTSSSDLIDSSKLPPLLLPNHRE